MLIFQNGGKTRGKKDRMKGKSMKDAKKDRKEYSQEEREEKEKKERMKQRKKGRTLKSEENVREEEIGPERINRWCVLSL